MQPKQPIVTIYSTATCHYCKDAKAFLNEMDVPFTEYNVGTDHEKRAEMVEKSGGRMVPVITVDDKVFVGFDKFKEAVDSGLRIR